MWMPGTIHVLSFVIRFPEMALLPTDYSGAWKGVKEAGHSWALGLARTPSTGPGRFARENSSAGSRLALIGPFLD